MKSIASARSMWRARKWTMVPERMYQTPQGIVAGTNGIAELGKLAHANGTDRSMLNTFAGMRVYYSKACDAYRRDDGFPLRKYAARYLNKYARRKAP